MPPKRKAAAATAGSPPAATTTTTRATKRRTPGDKSAAPAAKKRATTARSTTAKSTAAPFSAASCRAWFDSYADPDEPETIGPDGIERLCNDLGMDPASFPILVLAFTLNAADLGTFTASEWTVAMTKHQLHTTEQLKAFLNHDAARIQADRWLFRDCYKYAFELMRQPPARAVPLDMATDMWPLVLGHQAQWARVTADWLAFLSEESRGVKVITRDQWTSWLDFVSQTTPPFDQYDADGSAWPTLMDSFVAWYRTRAGASR
ncbi:hypothetical protein AMAG_16138 [Allomyces macrogynus ATCC 38327]|uniref:Defective in cullin neddylation protein n=1 Tax=Allomyces macrogynus (strain ATCC 38327) TaxID=578462 RepID=A0A0L0TA29_ALLM3|nr:hypothetical protein AMAG_16138 [Allomyces macrogynus ATCC 38327]|eukprot:KNE71576.1 hypothetical protein AMAG_16138 [Allomyces macrogynus ATCC 38327]